MASAMARIGSEAQSLTTQWTVTPRSRRPRSTSNSMRSAPPAITMPPQSASTLVSLRLRPYVMHPFARDWGDGRRQSRILGVQWCVPQFEKIDVDQEPVPKRLEKMKDEPFPAVEKPKPAHVAVEEIECGAHEQRQPAPDALLPAHARVRVTEGVGRTSAVASRRLPMLLQRLLPGIAVVLRDPVRDVRFILVVFD